MRLTKWLRTWHRRRQFEADLAEEMRIHREMSGAAAFGSEALALEQSREVWGFAWLDGLQQDIRYALRGLRRSPGFTFAVLGALALGIGLNTTAFTMFNAYVLRPYAVQDPYSLVEVRWLTKDGLGEPCSRPDYERLRAERAVFADVIATHDLVTEVSGRSMFGQMVSENYFSMLGIGTAIGRPLLPGDTGTMVLTHDAWRNQFAQDPAIVGRKVYMRGQPYEIVGVARPGFQGIQGVAMSFWVPLDGRVTVDAIGRLRPGVQPEAARAALMGWAHSIEPKATAVRLDPRASSIVFNAEVFLVFLPLFVAFGLILLTACANVSNMMLARSLAREREIAIRVSLGAGRGRLIRQLLTESAVLAIGGAALGFAVSEATLHGSIGLMYATVPPAFARMVVVNDFSPDWRVFGYATVAALASAAFFGLAPALQSTRPQLRRTRPGRLRNALVIVQTTVCTLLLAATVIVLGAQRVAAGRQTGLDLHGVWEVKLPPRFQLAAAKRFAATSEVMASAVVYQTPVYGGFPDLPVIPSGAKNSVRVAHDFVSAQYFDVFRIPMRRGRSFSDAESGAAVALVSESAAKLFWPGADPLGQTLAFPPVESQEQDRRPPFASVRVVGVVKDVVNGNPAYPRDPACIYLPSSISEKGNEAILVRLAPGPGDARRRIDAILDGIGPQAADFVTPMDDVLALQRYPLRVALWLTGFLGGVALLLTVSGIYGVTSFLVTQRTKEIGIRVALGADAGNVVWMVFRQSGRLAAIGAVIGSGFVAMIGPMRGDGFSQLLNPYDWRVYAVTAILVFTATAGASLGPSRRAARIDPAVSLRAD
jgi:predicted permease